MNGGPIGSERSRRRGAAPLCHCCFARARHSSSTGPFQFDWSVPVRLAHSSDFRVLLCWAASAPSSKSPISSCRTAGPFLVRAYLLQTHVPLVTFPTEMHCRSMDAVRCPLARVRSGRPRTGGGSPLTFGGIPERGIYDSGSCPPLVRGVASGCAISPSTTGDGREDSC